MKLSVLVAWRDPGERAALWEYVRRLYAAHLPEAEVIEASDDGIDPFHKTLALNRAAARASGDVYMIADADSWVASRAVREGLRLVQDGLWVRPWRIKVKLSKPDTARVLRNLTWDGEVDDLMADPHRFENLNTYWAAPHLLVSREHYELVGGFDERFRGWGQEDEAFALSLRGLVGRQQALPGYCVHLFHPRIGRSGHDLWKGQADNLENLDLIREYQKSIRDRSRMEALVERRKQNVQIGG